MRVVHYREIGFVYYGLNRNEVRNLAPGCGETNRFRGNILGTIRAKVSGAETASDPAALFGRPGGRFFRTLRPANRPHAGRAPLTMETVGARSDCRGPGARFRTRRAPPNRRAVQRC